MSRSLTAQRHQTLWLVLIFCSVALLVTGSAWSHPWGYNNSGYGALVKSADGTVNAKVDGFYYIARIEDLDVPFTSGTTGIVPPCGAEWCINGGNARAQQIVATYPMLSAQNGEFLANGYVAGCALDEDDSRVCTGIHPNGGVYKRWYQDGWICDPSYNCGYYFTGDQLNAVSTGVQHQFQMQRNGGAPGGGYWWRGWFNSGDTWFAKEFARGIHRPQMWHGESVLGAENLNFTAWDGGLPLNMEQDDWRVIRYHEFGQPSSNPPGTTNYAVPNSWHLSDSACSCMRNHSGARDRA